MPLSTRGWLPALALMLPSVAFADAVMVTRAMTASTIMEAFVDEATIVVELEDRVKHPLYSKIIRRTTKVKAHDEKGDAGVGDRVQLMETRPLSATKHWRLVEVLEKAK